MKLRKLLLGSTAALFAGGAVSTAQAADTNGLLVAAAATPVNSCNNGNGWSKGTWCLTFSGGATYTTRYGYDIDWSYGALPSMNPNIDVPTEITEPGIFNTDLHALSVSLSLLVTRANVRIGIPIVGGSSSFSVGPWTLNGSGLTYRPDLGDVTLALMLREAGGLGWNDRLRDDNSPARFEWGAVPGVPDFGYTATFGAGFGEITIGANAGLRMFDNLTAAPPPGASYASTNFGPNQFWTFGLDFGVEIPLGNWTFTGNAMLDRISVPYGYVIVAGDDNDTVNWDLDYAYGFTGELEGDLGPLELTLNGGIGYNSGRYTGYNYFYETYGRYFNVGAEIGFDIGDATGVGFEVGYNGGPNPLGQNDRVLTVGANVTHEVNDNLDLRWGVDYERQMIAGGIRIMELNAGFTLNPGPVPSFTIRGDIFHQWELGGLLADPHATRAQFVFSVTF